MLVELLVYVTVSMTFTLSIVNIPLNNNHKECIECKQINAMETLSRQRINEYYWFNHNGNINKGGQIQIGTKTCVVYIGFGRINCETI